MGMVDLDLRSSPGWLAASVATCCPGRVVEHLKSKSTQLRCQTIRVTLYITILTDCFSSASGPPPGTNPAPPNSELRRLWLSSKAAEAEARPALRLRLQ